MRPHSPHSLDRLLSSCTRLPFPVVALCLFGLVHQCDARVQNVRIEPEGRWTYLAKFSFSIGTGQVLLDLGEATPSLKDYQFHVYLDEHWDAVKALPDTHEGCLEQLRMTKGRVIIGDTGHGAINVSQHVRAHYWFVAVVNCNAPPASLEMINGLSIKLTFLNEGGVQFSEDDRGMLSLYAILLVVLFIGGGWFASRLAEMHNSPGGIPTAVAFLGTVLGVQLMTILLQFVHLWAYSYNGVGLPSLDFLSSVADMVANLLTVSLFLLLAMGWMINTNKIPQMSVLIQTFAVLLIVHLVLVYANKSYDDAHSKFHPTETLPGFIIMVTRTLMWGAFMTMINKSKNGETNSRKVGVYEGIQVAASVWFLALPGLVLLATVFAAYLRHKLVAGGNVVLQCTAVAMLCNLFLSRGEFFKVSKLSASLLPASHLQ